MDGVIVTKLDGTAKGGIALAVTHELGLPVLKIGVGEGLDDLQATSTRTTSRAPSSARSTSGASVACVQVHRDPDVFEVRVPFENISTNDTNCYIVRDGDDTLVVDTGAPSDEGFAILDAALAELGVDRARAAFFLTHLHLDHAGLVDRIALPGARLYVSPVDFEAVRASRAASSYDSARRAFVAEGVSPSDASGYARYAVEPRLFDASRLTLVPSCEGDAIDVGRYRFRVVETPGHTPGHLSLYEPQSRILFSGDHVLFVISPSIALFPDGADGLQAYLDSLDKVRRLACRRLFVSHGSRATTSRRASTGWPRTTSSGSTRRAPSCARTRALQAKR